MLHSILIIGNSKTSLTTLINITHDSLTPNPDLLILEPDPSIGIKEVRQLESFLSRKPYQKDKKIAVIKQAQTLTLPAQNALLKTLEEPPANSLIALLTSSPNKLLPTIISRCQLINSDSDSILPASDLAEQKQLFNDITQASLGQRVNLAATHASNKPAALSLVKDQLLYLKPQLKKHSSLIKKILATQKSIAKFPLESNNEPYGSTMLTTGR